MRQHTAAFALFLLGGVFVLGLLALACGEGDEAETPFPTITAHFIDVRHGDAILIEANGTVILVDGGKASANVEAYLQAQGIQDIDLMVATHPHEDHIEGLIDVLNLYDVHEIWTNGQTRDKQFYRDFAEAGHRRPAPAVTHIGYKREFVGATSDVRHGGHTADGRCDQG